MQSGGARGGNPNLPRAPDMRKEEVPLLAVGEGDAVAHWLTARRDEPHGRLPRGADRRDDDNDHRYGEHGGGEDDDEIRGARRALEANKAVAHVFVRVALTQLKRPRKRVRLTKRWQVYGQQVECGPRLDDQPRAEAAGEQQVGEARKVEVV